MVDVVDTALTIQPNVVKETVGIIWWIALGVAILALFAILGWYIWTLKQYKTKFIVRQITNNERVKIIEDKARFKKDKDGNHYYKLWFMKESAPLPNEDALNITGKGKDWLEAYRTLTGEYIYINDRPSIKAIPKEVLRERDPEKKAAKLDEWQKSENVKFAFVPLNTTQRATTINQIVKAQSRNKQSWKQQLPIIVSIIAVTILILSLMVFWGDLAKPLLSMADKIQTYENTRVSELQIIQEIKQDIQTIKQEQNTAPTQAPN